MPYIDRGRRQALEDGSPIATPGELQYAFALHIKDYWEMNEQNYQTINDILGALNGANLEFYHRVVRPYEDQKIISNGDVY